MDAELVARTGTLLYALGNVYEGLGNSGESFKYHTRALIQFRATVGNSHPVTAMALYKMAGHAMTDSQTSVTKASYVNLSMEAHYIMQGMVLILVQLSQGIS
jgi:hypothetical protein